MSARPRERGVSSCWLWKLWRSWNAAPCFSSSACWASETLGGKQGSWGNLSPCLSPPWLVCAWAPLGALRSSQQACCWVRSALPLAVHPPSAPGKLSLNAGQLFWASLPYRVASHEMLPSRSLRRIKSALPKARVAILLFVLLLSGS